MVYLCPFSGTKASIKAEPEEILSVPGELQIVGLHNLPPAEAVNKIEQQEGRQADQRITEMFSPTFRRRLAANFCPLSAFGH